MTRGPKPDVIVAGSSPVTEVPNPPAWLSRDARAEWRRVAPILIHERRTLTLADLSMLANYCAAVGQVSEAGRILKREGITYQSLTGPKKHPAVSIMSDGMTQARQMAGELGLTPASRSRPAIREDNGEDLSDLDL